MHVVEGVAGVRLVIEQEAEEVGVVGVGGEDSDKKFGCERLTMKIVVAVLYVH